MQITTQTLRNLCCGFKTEFQNAFDAVPKIKDSVAKTIQSSTSSNVYG